MYNGRSTVTLYRPTNTLLTSMHSCSANKFRAAIGLELRTFYFPEDSPEKKKQPKEGEPAPVVVNAKVSALLPFWLQSFFRHLFTVNHFVTNCSPKKTVWLLLSTSLWLFPRPLRSS